jgi:hypothetical protein
MTLPRLIFPVCGQTRKHSGRLFHLSFSFVDPRSLQNCNAWQDKFLAAQDRSEGKNEDSTSARTESSSGRTARKNSRELQAVTGGVFETISSLARAAQEEIMLPWEK